MNSINKILCKIAKESDGKMRIVKVPIEKRPTAESLRNLEKKIHTQIEANRAMEYRSFVNASKRV